VLSLITTMEDEVAPEVDAAKAPALQSSGNAEVRARSGWNVRRVPQKGDRQSTAV
jgi:hypothetical protein